jgi:hypothetical protein
MNIASAPAYLQVIGQVVQRQTVTTNLAAAVKGQRVPNAALIPPEVQSP